MSRTILLYGETDTKKTTNAREFARWLRRRYANTKWGGLPVGLISADSGWGPAQEDVDAGHILPIKLSSCKYPIAVIKQLSSGYWPVDLDIQTGLFTECDVAGKTRLVLQDFNKKPMVCGYIVEGLHENAKVFLGDAEDKGRAIGEPLQGTEWDKDNNRFNFKYVELGEKLVLRSRGTYYHAQAVTERYVNKFKALPVPWVMMTTHQTLGKDDNDRDVLGPAIIGTSNIDKITGWFESSFHAVSAPYDHEYRVTDFETGKYLLSDGVTWVLPEDSIPEMKFKMATASRMGAVLWFQQHQDKVLRNQFWRSKLGVTTAQYARIMKRWPDGHMWLMLDEETGECTQSLATLMEMIDPL